MFVVLVSFTFQFDFILNFSGGLDSKLIFILNFSTQPKIIVYRQILFAYLRDFSRFNT